MAYPTPTNLTDMGKVFSYADTVSGGVFYFLIPTSLFLVIFIHLKIKGYDIADCGLAASFITSIASAFLFFMGGLSSYALSVPVIVLVLFIIWAFLKSE